MAAEVRCWREVRTDQTMPAARAEASAQSRLTPSLCGYDLLAGNRSDLYTNQAKVPPAVIK